MAWDSSRFKFRNEIPQLEGTDPVSETTVGGLSLDEPQATKDSIPAYVDYTAQTLSEDPKKPGKYPARPLYLKAVIDFHSANVYWTFSKKYPLEHLVVVQRLWRFTFQRPATGGAMGARNS